MKPETFKAVSNQFHQFHQYFSPVLARQQWRQQAGHYLEGLLVQGQERRNVENLAEAVAVAPRNLQRFISESPWPSEPLIARLQEYLGPKLNAPLGVWTLDESSFPKQGTHSVGVARQYCGALGKVANCQVGVFLAYVSSRGHALVEEQLFLPAAWVADPARCQAAGIPQEHLVYRSEAQLALQLVQRAVARGHLQAQWVTADEIYGQSPDLRDGLAALDLNYVLEVSSQTTVWPLEVPLERRLTRRGRLSARLWPALSARRQICQRAAALPASAWQRLTVAQGAQGPLTYRFACERGRMGRDQRRPGEVGWLLYRTQLDGSQWRYYFSNAPAQTPLRVLAQVACARWPIETEFQTDKNDLGLDEYEVRSWAGWHHHMTLCLLTGAFLVSLQQAWQKPMPEITRPQVYRVVRHLLARPRWTLAQLQQWLKTTQNHNRRAKASHQKRRAAQGLSPPALGP